MKNNELLQAESWRAHQFNVRSIRPSAFSWLMTTATFACCTPRWLARPGYHVDAAEDGASRLGSDSGQQLQSSDHRENLPKLTGIELVRKLRAARLAVPVVMAAVRLPTLELVQNPPLQLAALLSKPFYISELLQTVRAVLRATDSSRSRSRHCQTGEASRQPVFAAVMILLRSTVCREHPRSSARCFETKFKRIHMGWPTRRRGAWLTLSVASTGCRLV